MFHELGHVLGAIYFNWNIERILLLPFGGLTIFNENINKPIKEEFIICILGPIFQIIFYYLMRTSFEIKNIHYNLLLFNLLPIVPLDGSKLLNLLLNKILSFKNSLIITNMVSLFFLLSFIFLTIISKKILLILVFVFLVFNNINELKKTKYIINRFILERSYNHLNMGKIKYINGDDLTNMYRNKRHIFIINKKYYIEKEIIRKRFDL